MIWIFLDLAVFSFQCLDGYFLLIYLSIVDNALQFYSVDVSNYLPIKSFSLLSDLLQIL